MGDKSFPPPNKLAWACLRHPHLRPAHLEERKKVLPQKWPHNISKLETNKRQVVIYSLYFTQLKK